MDNVSIMLTQNVMAMTAPVAKPLVMYICCLQKLTTYMEEKRAYSSTKRPCRKVRWSPSYKHKGNASTLAPTLTAPDYILQELYLDTKARNDSCVKAKDVVAGCLGDGLTCSVIDSDDDSANC